MGELRRLRSVRYSEKRFRLTFERTGIRPGSFEAKALAQTIGELRTQSLPDPADYELPRLPLAEIVNWGRDVPRTSLRLVYSFDDVHVLLISVHRRS